MWQLAKVRRTQGHWFDPFHNQCQSHEQQYVHIQPFQNFDRAKGIVEFLLTFPESNRGTPSASRWNFDNEEPTLHLEFQQRNTPPSRMFWRCLLWGVFQEQFLLTSAHCTPLHPKLWWKELSAYRVHPDSHKAKEAWVESCQGNTLHKPLLCRSKRDIQQARMTSW